MRCSINHDAFADLTPDAAYWCGFLFADGSIGQREGRAAVVAVVLSERDRGHVEKLRAFLGSSHAITPVRPSRGGPAVRFAFSSARIAQHLMSLGRYDVPLSQELARSRDFWRGMVDGDGHVGIHHGQATVKLVGSQRILTAYADYMNAEVQPIRNPLAVRPHKSIYVVSAGWSTAERITEHLYCDAGTVLERKALAAAGILERREIALRDGTHPEVRLWFCDYWHFIGGDNIYWRRDGKWACKPCNARRAREAYARKKARDAHPVAPQPFPALPASS